MKQEIEIDCFKQKHMALVGKLNYNNKNLTVLTLNPIESLLFE